jgi:hypothetical protein
MPDLPEYTITVTEAPAGFASAGSAVTVEIPGSLGSAKPSLGPPEYTEPSVDNAHVCTYVGYGNVRGDQNHLREEIGNLWSIESMLEKDQYLKPNNLPIIKTENLNGINVFRARSKSKFIRTVEINPCTVRIPDSGLAVPNYLIPIRMYSHLDIPGGDLFWNKLFKGGTYAEKSYPGLIPSNTLYYDTMFKYTKPYSVLEKKKSNIPNPNRTLDMSYKYRAHLKDYESSVDQMDSELLIPNYYTYQYLSDANKDYRKYATLNGAFTPMEIYNQMFDSNIKAYRYLDDKFANADFTEGLKSKVINSQKNIIFDDVYHKTLSAGIKAPTPVNNFPYYMTFKFPEHTGREPDNQCPFVVRDAIARHDFSSKFLEILKDVYDVNFPGIAPTLSTFTVQETSLTGAHNYGRDPGLPAVESSRVSQQSLKSVDFIEFLTMIYNNYSSSLNDDYSFAGPKRTPHDSTYSATGFDRYYNNKATMGVLDQVIKYSNHILNKEPLNYLNLKNVINLQQNPVETLAYRVEKIGGSATLDSNTENVLQNFWFFNSQNKKGRGQDAEFEFIDTQVKYGQKYTYNLYAYALVPSYRYKFTNLRLTKQIARIDSDGDGITDLYCMQFYNPANNNFANQVFYDNRYLPKPGAGGPKALPLPEGTAPDGIPPIVPDYGPFMPGGSSSPFSPGGGGGGVDHAGSPADGGFWTPELIPGSYLPTSPGYAGPTPSAGGWSMGAPFSPPSAFSAPMAPMAFLSNPNSRPSAMFAGQVESAIPSAMGGAPGTGGGGVDIDWDSVQQMSGDGGVEEHETNNGGTVLYDTGTGKCWASHPGSGPDAGEWVDCCEYFSYDYRPIWCDDPGVTPEDLGLSHGDDSTHGADEAIGGHGEDGWHTGVGDPKSDLGFMLGTGERAFEGGEKGWAYKEASKPGQSWTVVEGGYGGQTEVTYTDTPGYGDTSGTGGSDTDTDTGYDDGGGGEAPGGGGGGGSDDDSDTGQSGGSVGEMVVTAPRERGPATSAGAVQHGSSRIGVGLGFDEDGDGIPDYQEDEEEEPDGFYHDGEGWVVTTSRPKDWAAAGIIGSSGEISEAYDTIVGSNDSLGSYKDVAGAAAGVISKLFKDALLSGELEGLKGSTNEDAPPTSATVEPPPSMPIYKIGDLTIGLDKIHYGNEAAAVSVSPSGWKLTVTDAFFNKKKKKGDKSTAGGRTDGLPPRGPGLPDIPEGPLGPLGGRGTTQQMSQGSSGGPQVLLKPGHTPATFKTRRGQLADSIASYMQNQKRTQYIATMEYAARHLTTQAQRSLAGRPLAAAPSYAVPGYGAPSGMSAPGAGATAPPGGGGGMPPGSGPPVPTIGESYEFTPPEPGMMGPSSPGILPPITMLVPTCRTSILAPRNRYATLQQDLSDSPHVADVYMHVEPCFKLIEIPIYSKTQMVLDHPGNKASVYPFQYLDDSNRLGFEVSYESHVSSKFPTVISAADQLLKDNYLFANNKLPKDMIKTKSVSRARYIEVYRLKSKPTKFTDFAGQMIKRIDLQIEESDYVYADTVHEADVNTNEKYYYLFRFLNEHFVICHPSEILECELVDDGGYKYATFGVLYEEQLRQAPPNNTTIQMKKLLQIKPNISQLMLTTDRVDFDKKAHTQLNQVGVGSAKDLIWGKTFKLRLTSKKTGRKLDLNINFKIEETPEPPIKSVPAGVLEDDSDPKDKITVKPIEISPGSIFDDIKDILDDYIVDGGPLTVSPDSIFDTSPGADGFEGSADTGTSGLPDGWSVVPAEPGPWWDPAPGGTATAPGAYDLEPATPSGETPPGAGPVFGAGPYAGLSPEWAGGDPTETYVIKDYFWWED